MNKEYIMQFLKTCEELKLKYEGLEAREGYIRRTLQTLKKEPNIAYKKKNTSVIPGVIMTSLAMGLLFSPFIALALALFKFSPSNFLFNVFHWPFANEHPYWTHWLFSFIVPSICLIPFSLMVQSQQKQADLAVMQNYNDQLHEKPTLEEELKSIAHEKKVVKAHIQHELSRGILYEGYFPYANHLWWYLKKGQADTLKEAINLLEQELSNDERQRAEEKFRKELLSHAQRQEDALELIADDADRVANAAESAALWSATSTLLTADEIRRQRKKE